MPAGRTARKRRERIAAYQAQGLTAIDMALKLRISPQAVYHHLKALGLKPNTRDREQEAAAR